MKRCPTFNKPWVLAMAVLLGNGALAHRALAQPGLRDTLREMDRNRNGQLDPEEVSPLARPYLERITRERHMSLDRPNSIEKILDAARIYFALRNGVSGKDVRPQGEDTVLPFGPREDEPLVPEFGLGVVKYPYIKADRDLATTIMRRYDRSGDGHINREEASRNRWTHRDPFLDDLDKDGRLSVLELTQRYARRRLLDGSAGEMFQRARRTGNGVRAGASRYGSQDGGHEREAAKRREFSQWWSKGGSGNWLTASVLSRFDANRNGRLETGEANDLGVPVGQVDLNRDGELTRDELHAYLSNLQDQAGDVTSGLPGWFFELDSNRDQQVSMAEFASEWTEEKFREFRLFDANGDGLLTATETLQSKALSGGSYSNRNAEVLPPHKTIISEIEITDEHLIGDLNVELSITHSSVGFLDGYLTGPDGTRVELFTGVGGTGDHFDRTIFDDQSRTSITKTKPPYRGEFQPEALLKKQPSLSHFNGKGVKGVWQLVIRGTRNTRFGMLHSWGLIIRPAEDGPGPLTAPPTEEQPPAPAVGSAPPASGDRSEDAERAASDAAAKIEARNRMIEEYKRRFSRGKEGSSQRDEGREASGDEKSRYNKKGYEKKGYEKKGYDKKSYDKKDYDKKDYDKKDYDKKSYEKKDTGGREPERERGDREDYKRK